LELFLILNLGAAFLLKNGKRHLTIEVKRMKIEKLINFCIPVFCGILLILMTGVVFMQIVFREFFNFSLNWSDEVAQFIMMWMVLLGSIWLTKHDQHLNTGIKLHKNLNERLSILIDGILALVTIASTAIVAYQSLTFSFLAMRFSSSSLLWLKMGYVYIVLPLFMLSVCYYSLKNFFKNLVLFFKKVFHPGLPEQSKE
jgi:TRAP-type C4-dicarboxylate transport system permease small subunit